MTYKFIIDGRLDGMNEFIRANRTNPHVGNNMKRENQDIVVAHIWKHLRGVKITKPVIIKYDFYEKNKRRDLDNISSFARKVIQDALVETGVLKGDGWSEIAGSLDQYYLDKDNPRIEITITEAGG